MTGNVSNATSPRRPPSIANKTQNNHIASAIPYRIQDRVMNTTYIISSKAPIWPTCITWARYAYQLALTLPVRPPIHSTPGTPNQLPSAALNRLTQGASRVKNRNGRKPKIDNAKAVHQYMSVVLGS